MTTTLRGFVAMTDHSEKKLGSLLTPRGTGLWNSILDSQRDIHVTRDALVVRCERQRDHVRLLAILTVEHARSIGRLAMYCNKQLSCSYWVLFTYPSRSYDSCRYGRGYHCSRMPRSFRNLSFEAVNPGNETIVR